MSTRPNHTVPTCPDCGTSNVKRIWHDSEARGPGYAAGPSTPDSPVWACLDCAAQFGRGAPETAVTTRTIEEWQALLPKMMPAPIEVQKNGDVWGGENCEVIVAVDEHGVHVMESKITWQGAHTPTVSGIRGNALPLTSPASVVAAAITRAWALQLAKLQWCARCHYRVREEHMWGTALCQGCASQHLGIIY
ncbi:MAG TPA: hypothetical protein VHO25_15070 [Polyangiaceae bacterium]|nr:hypothetical protein [Polyangiaceae bacterium]